MVVGRWHVLLFIMIILLAGCKIQLVEKRNTSDEVIIEEITPSPAPAPAAAATSSGAVLEVPFPPSPEPPSLAVPQHMQPMPAPAEPPGEQAVVPLRPFSTLPYQPPDVIAEDSATPDILLQRPVGEVRVHMLDVGDGESILVESDKTMLIDCGPEEIRKKTAAYLQRQGITAIDVLILSNLERERIGACPYILREFDIKRVIQNDLAVDDIAYKKIKEIAEEEEIPIERLFHDTNFTLDQNIDVGLHVPYDKGLLSEMKSHVIALRLVHGDLSFLFMSDCGKGCERIFFDNQSLDYAVTIYSIGVHAEQKSATRLLFYNLSAQVGLLSVNRSLNIEQADPEVVKRYAGHGLRVYRTDYDGSIVVTSDGKKYNISVSKGVEHWKEGTEEETASTPSPDCPYVAHYNSIYYYTFDCPLAGSIVPQWKLCFADDAEANATRRKLDSRCA